MVNVLVVIILINLKWYKYVRITNFYEDLIIKKLKHIEIINLKGSKGSNDFTFQIEICFHLLSKENKWFELALYITIEHNS